MRAIAIVVYIVATSALAGPQAVWKDGSTRTYWPSRIAWPDGRETLGANTAQVEAAGEARPETKQEQEDREKREADAAKAAQEQAEVYADIEPATFAPRMEGTNVLGQSQLMFDANNIPYGVTDTGSPKHTAEDKAADRAAHESRKAMAKIAKTDKEKIALLMKAVFGIE